MELTNWRWSWRGSLVISVLAPLLSILGLGVFARDSGPQALAYVLTGNVVISLTMDNLNKLQSHFVFIRWTGALDYYASLPIQRYVLIVAMVAAFLLLSLPALLTTLIVGALVLRVPITPHPLALLVAPLCALPLAGIGALIGASVRHRQNAGSISLFVSLLLAGLGPVVVPPDRLAPVLLMLGYINPATYAASALRQTLLGPVTSRIVVDIVVLVIASSVTLWLASRRLDWRQR